MTLKHKNKNTSLCCIYCKNEVNSQQTINIPENVHITLNIVTIT